MSEIALPSVLNEDLVKRALQTYHSVNSSTCLNLKNCDFKRSLVSGENYCSDIYQIDVEYEINDGNTNNKSFIVKIMIPEFIDIGSNEKIMFSELLPAMENILKSKNIENPKLHGQCWLYENNKDEIYVLENLNSLGYSCAERTKGLDLQQSRILIKKIAKFHAASMFYVKQYPEILKSMSEGSHFEKGVHNTMTESLIYGGLEYVASMVEQWPSYEGIAEKLRSVIPKFNDAIAHMINTNNSTFNVINHGDLWVNNFLLKYDNESLNCNDATFVDFQNCFWGSCGFDINYFLNTSLQLNVLKENRLELVQAYYNSLSETLKQINYPTREIPSFEDVLAEIRRCEIMGLYTTVCEFPIVTMAKSMSKDFDFIVFCDPEKIKLVRVSMYDNPRVLDTLKYTIKYFDEINIL